MTSVQQQLLADVLDELGQQLSPASFNVWFKNSARLTFDEEHKRLSVGVPNLFVCDLLESRYAALLAEVAERKLGPGISVHFHIDSRLFRERREAQLRDGAEFLASSPPAARATASPTFAATANGRCEGPLLTLDRFVVGDCNRMAYAAALEVVVNPGRAFNPLFIHGACGLGKTHLLQGILHAVRQRHAGRQVLYLTAEEFTNRYILAVKTHSLDGFRHRFRNMDLLVIDDIHFLANKQATQEEFLHTFNAFDMANRQVVMASDCHPKMLQSIQENLISRFVAGMVARLSAPDRKTRAAILRRKAEQLGAAAPEDVLEFIAQHVAGSVRDLEGALIRVVAYAALDKRPISLALTREALAEHADAARRVLDVQSIVEAVARFFGLPENEILGSKRTRAVTLPRQLAMFLARRLTPLSFPEIGRLMGGKNHTTVMAACKHVQKIAADNRLLTWQDGLVLRQMKSTELIETLEDSLRC